ncbi:MAG: uroporphyrinogen-III synthase [Pseudomonadota bacterium]
MTAIILTRPKPQADAFGAELQACLTMPILVQPLIEIETEPADVPIHCDAIIFTSANAVASLSSGKGGFALCVGDMTAISATGAGFNAVSVDGTAEDVAQHIIGDPRLSRLSWFHPHGAHVTGAFHNTLRTAGIRLETKVVYRQNTRAWSDHEFQRATNGANLFPVFSPNGARVLLSALGVHAGGMGFVALSDAVSRALVGIERFYISVAPAPNRAAMLEAIKKRVSATRFF